MKYDTLIRGGRLIDPAMGIDGVRDVAFAGGCVAAVGESLSVADARETVEATGCVVSPGMIDLHVHVFEGVTHMGIPADATCLATGATTVVDAGSAGAESFPGFRKFIIEANETRILAQLNISDQGMITRDVGELQSLEHANVARACEVIEQNRDVILGVKVRLTGPGIVSEAVRMSALHRAREAADAAGVPIMVHPQGAWCDSLDDILAVMGDRDILTHCFHGRECGVLDEDGRVRDSVGAAIERGVVIDVGHGAGSFSWDVAEKALEQGLVPQTISSDLHVYNLYGPVYDLATCVTKFVHLGLPLDEALQKVTAAPAKVIGMSDKIGTLAVGAWGDAVVFELRDGRFELMDSEKQTRTGRQKLAPVVVVRGGKVWRQRAA